MTAVESACARCEGRLEADDLRCPVCLHAAPAVRLEDRPQTAIEILRCSGCGAAMRYDVARRSPRCPFCGRTTKVERLEDPPEQVERYVPFTFERAVAERAFRSWLDGLGWFRPSDLKAASTIERLQPLWWVGWVTETRALVSWTADSDAGARKAQWAPHAGQTTFDLSRIVISASRGLSESETGGLAASYDLDRTIDHAVPGAEGTLLEQFDVRRSAARRHVERAIDRLVGRRLTGGVIPGRRFRNLHTEVLLRRLLTRRFAFPSWVLAYRYRRRLYRVVVSGQDAGCLLGSAPRSVAKIVLAVLGGLAALWLGLVLVMALLG